LREIFAFLGEPNFAQSANTFTVRINSSSIDQYDLDDISDPGIETADNIFRQLRTGKTASQITWGSQRVGILDEVINDMVEKVIAVLSGR